MNADKWDENYNGFNFPGFYDFIIDFFEDVHTEEEKKKAKELLKWWDKCVLRFLSRLQPLPLTCCIRQIFPNSSPANNTTTGNPSRARLAAQRRARAPTTAATAPPGPHAAAAPAT